METTTVTTETRFLRNGTVLFTTDLEGSLLEGVQARLVGRFGRGNWTRQTRTITKTITETAWR